MPQDTSGQTLRGSPILHGELSVHEDPVDSFWEIMRIVLERIGVRPQVRCAVPHPWQIEDDEVRGESGSDQATIAEPQAGRGHPCQLVDGVFECEDGFFDHEPLEDSRELAEGARLVRCRGRGSLLLGSDPAIRTDHDEWVA